MSEEKSLISIIVPIFKAEKYLNKCIDSVLEQTYTNWELILVDDGSPDGSAVICRSYVESDKRIRFFQQENKGASAARNRGIDLAKGDYLAFLDSDDYWHKCYLEYLFNLLVLHHASLAQCGMARGNSDVFPEIKAKIVETVYDNTNVFLKYKANVLIPGKLYKRSLWDTIRYPEGKAFEDDFTAWKLYFQAGRIVISSKPLYYYRYNVDSYYLGAQNNNPKLDFMEAYRERISFFEDKGLFPLRDVSINHYCKVLLLYYGNQSISEEKRKIIKSDFLHFWSLIKKSEYVNISFKILFRLFELTPVLATKLGTTIRKYKVARSITCDH